MRTAHTLHPDFKVCATRSRVSSETTHAFGGDEGYGLLKFNIFWRVAIDCNDRNANGFIGYNYPTYTCLFLSKIFLIIDFATR